MMILFFNFFFVDVISLMPKNISKECKKSTGAKQCKSLQRCDHDSAKIICNCFVFSGLTDVTRDSWLFFFCLFFLFVFAGGVRQEGRAGRVL